MHDTRVKLPTSRGLALWGITASRNLKPYLTFLQGAFVRVAAGKARVTRAVCQDDSATPGAFDSCIWEGHPRQKPAGLSPWLTQLHLPMFCQPPETIQIKTHQLAVVKPWINHAWRMHSETCCLSNLLGVDKATMKGAEGWVPCKQSSAPAQTH